MNAIERCDAMENALLRRIGEMNSEAMVDAIRRKKSFLQKIKDIDEGKIKPPQYYVDTNQVKKWREGFVRELIRQENVIEGIMEELDKAGVNLGDNDVVSHDLSEVVSSGMVIFVDEVTYEEKT